MRAALWKPSYTTDASWGLLIDFYFFFFLRARSTNWGMKRKRSKSFDQDHREERNMYYHLALPNARIIQVSYALDIYTHLCIMKLF